MQHLEVSVTPVLYIGRRVLKDETTPSTPILHLLVGNRLGRIGNELSATNLDHISGSLVEISERDKRTGIGCLKTELQKENVVPSPNYEPKRLYLAL
jgi:hypothetical protein